jgi:tetratricopeptide (TPR) repeat protein
VNKRFQAFISYSHADARWSAWLQRKLETYRVPRRVRGQPGKYGPVPERIGAVFRDREDLSAAGDLGDTIRSALAGSAALLVVCSPAAARSPWVDKEILSFKQLNGEDRIYALIVDGEPNAGDERECFPPALRFHLDADGRLSERRAEPLAADVRRGKDGRSLALLKMLSGLLGVDLDLLRQREQQRQHRRLLAIAAASVCGMMLTGYLAITASLARNDAQRRQAQAEDILGFMLGDLRQKLTTVGRLDLMRAVDDKATGYFASLDPRDISDRALEEQARSLTGIGRVRLDEGNHEEALSAFREAHSRSLVLFERQPEYGQRLFDLAQAEYWIGFVAWRQGRLDDAETWLTRYRDSALKLAAMDRSNFDWQREVAYGHHNLAVLDQSRGRIKEAERALRAELDLYRDWVNAHPSDTGLRSEAATVASWLGSLALREGSLKEARMLFDEQVEALSLNREAEPLNWKWRFDLLNALILFAEVEAKLGNYESAREKVSDASSLAAELVDQDSSNLDWLHAQGLCYWWKARLASKVAPGQAKSWAHTAERLFADVVTIQPEDERYLRWLSKSRLLLAELAIERRAQDEAANWLALAGGVLEPVWDQKPNDDLRLLMARLLLLQGETARMRIDSAAAEAAFSESERLLREGLGDPPIFERLDLLVRVLLRQHREQEAAPLVARLKANAYVPLPPWPESTAPRALTANP